EINAVRPPLPLAFTSAFAASSDLTWERLPATAARMMSSLAACDDVVAKRPIAISKATERKSFHELPMGVCLSTEVAAREVTKTREIWPSADWPIASKPTGSSHRGEGSQGDYKAGNNAETHAGPTSAKRSKHVRCAPHLAAPSPTTENGP